MSFFGRLFGHSRSRQVVRKLNEGENAEDVLLSIATAELRERIGKRFSRIYTTPSQVLIVDDWPSDSDRQVTAYRLDQEAGGITVEETIAVTGAKLMQHHPRKLNGGFTLVELLVVMAIVSIIGMLAMSSYQDYQVRAQVTEGVSLLKPIRTEIEAYIGANGAPPATLATLGLGAPGDHQGTYVQSIAVDNGSVIMTFGGAANAQLAGTELMYTPFGSVSGDEISWRCQNQTMPVGLTQIGTPGALTTPTPLQFLPQICRT